MMKKALLSVFLVMLIFGCRTTSDNDEIKNPVDNGESVEDTFLNTYKTTLMEDVESSDILIYEKVAFTKIEFSVRDSLSYSAGKDIYIIQYFSSAEPEDIYDAYVDYIDTIEEESADEYSLDIEGTVNSLPIYVSVYLESQNGIEGYEVYLRISEDPSKFADENRYYSDYPDLVEKYELLKDGLFYAEVSYSESYLDGIKTYLTSYQSSATEDEFKTFYENSYSEKTDFEYKEDDYNKKLMWSDSGFDIKISFSEATDGVGVQMFVMTTLP